VKDFNRQVLNLALVCYFLAAFDRITFGVAPGNGWWIVKAGERVASAGVYKITHQAHRPNHTAILQKGEIFPSCRACGHAVQFEFVEPAIESATVEHIGYDADFMDAVLGERKRADRQEKH
jgi:hypothetical protein